MALNVIFGNTIRKGASLLTVGLFMAGLSLAADATPANSDTKCDSQDAAELVKRQLQETADLPSTKTILSSPAALYYELVMREPHEKQANKRIYYGTDLQQFGDLRLPKGRGPFPVAVLVHGGGWGSAVSLHYMSSLAASLACAGVATWNIEFRRLGSGGEWPGMFRDVAAGTDFLRELASKYPLDINRGVVTMGHSSGGSLAMWLAMRHRLPADSELYSPNPMPVAGGISLDGAVDMFARLKDGPSVAATFKQLFGADGASEDVIDKRMKDASPRMYLPLGVRQAIVQGKPGGFPSYGCCGTPEHVAEAKAAGDQIDYIVIDGYHFQSADPTNAQAGPAIRRIVKEMLNQRSQ